MPEVDHIDHVEITSEDQRLDVAECCWEEGGQKPSTNCELLELVN